MVRVARVYQAPDADDGVRVLVDRLWPRGFRRDSPNIDRWLKDVAPSTELRRWYGHRPDRAVEFRRRYEEELEEPDRRAALAELRELAGRGVLTLLTSTSEIEMSHLTVLADVLDQAPDS